MGEVFVGWDETLKRKVALKAIRGDQRFDTEAKARFLREARILSQLDHPGICRIYELIEGEQESSFLVLELLEGATLRDELKAGMELPFRLYVAEKVAEALSAAHTQGIVHRDLKPENVMLTQDGTVKVLDFGLAQTVDISPSLSPPAASLDQVRSDSTTAEDLAGLEATVTLVDGGHPPSGLPPDGSENPTIVHHDVTQLTPSDGSHDADQTFFKTQAGMVMGTVAYMSPEQARGESATAAGDMFSFGLMLQEMITGRSAYGEGLGAFEILTRAAQGESEPAENPDPDLVTLIERLKSLAPEGRPSALECAERLWRIRGKRNRRLRNLAIGLALFGLFAGSAKYAIDLRREREEAVQARQEAEEVSNFLVGLFDVSAPGRARGQEISARELLDAGAERIQNLDGQPLSQARMMLTIGRVFRRLGLYQRARPLLEAALEIRQEQLPADPETVTYIDQLASLHHELAELLPAEALFQQSLELRRKVLGPEHPHIAASLTNLAMISRARGDENRAEPMLREALRIQRQAYGDDHPDVAKSLNNLADLLRARGQLEQAEPYFRRALEIQQRLLGADHPDLISALNNLAMVHHRRGLPQEAEALYDRTLALSEKVLGTEHPTVATILNNLAELHRHTGRFTDSETLYGRALKIQQEALGPSHPALAATLTNLGDLHRDRGQPAQAEAFYQQALVFQDQLLDSDASGLAVTLNHLADVLVDLGRFDEAEELYQQALRIQDQAGDKSSGLISTLLDLGDLCRLQGRLDIAETLYRRALDEAQKEARRQPENLTTRRVLAGALLGQGRLQAELGAAEDARASWNRVLEVMSLGSDSSATLKPIAMIADLEIIALCHLLIGDVEAARPVVEVLLATEHRPAEILRLSRVLGLVEATEAGLLRLSL